MCSLEWSSHHFCGPCSERLGCFCFLGLGGSVSVCCLTRPDGDGTTEVGHAGEVALPVGERGDGVTNMGVPGAKKKVDEVVVLNFVVGQTTPNVGAEAGAEAETRQAVMIITEWHFTREMKGAGQADPHDRKGVIVAGRLDPALR